MKSHGHLPRIEHSQLRRPLPIAALKPAVGVRAEPCCARLATFLHAVPKNGIKLSFQVKLGFLGALNRKNGLVLSAAIKRFNLTTKNSTNPYAGFGERLQEACNAADIPRGRERSGSLALRFGVTPEAVRQWLNGRAVPEVSRLLELAEELECSLDWLLQGRLPSEGQLREPGGAYKTLSAQERAVIGAMRKLSARRREALVQLLADQ